MGKHSAKDPNGSSTWTCDGDGNPVNTKGELPADADRVRPYAGRDSES